MTVQWNDASKTGDAEIGAQHQELFRRVNFLLDMTGNLSLGKCLISLFKFAREHSSHEKHGMRKTPFPDIIPHRIERTEILTQLNRVAESIANKTIVNQDWRASFNVWLIHPLETSDQGLVADLNFGSVGR